MKIHIKFLSGALIVGVLIYILRRDNKYYILKANKETQTDIEFSEKYTQIYELNKIEEVQNEENNEVQNKENNEAQNEENNEVQNEYNFLYEMTSNELKEYAKLHNIKGISRLKKSQLIEIIKENI